MLLGSFVMKKVVRRFGAWGMVALYAWQHREKIKQLAAEAKSRLDKYRAEKHSDAA